MTAGAPEERDRFRRSRSPRWRLMGVGPSTIRGRFLAWFNWWHITGLAGVLFAIGSFALAVSPARDFLRYRFRVSDVAGFFDDRASATLLVTYLDGLLVGVVLLVFASGLRSYLSRAEGGYSMWSHLVLVAGGVAAAVTLAMQPFAQTLALAGATGLDESLLDAAVWFTTTHNNAVAVPIATLVLATSIVDLRTKIFGWLAGFVGLAAVALTFTGLAWPLVGTPRGVLGFLMLFGRLLTTAWFVLVGVKLMAVKRPPLHMPGEGLFDPSSIVEGWNDEDGA